MRSLLGDELRDLALERRVEPLLLRDLVLDVALRRSAFRDHLRLLLMRALEDVTAVLHGRAKLFHLGEHICVRLRHRPCVVDARDHVVKALRTEHDFERRLLIRRVQRDETLRDRALPDFQVVLRNDELTTVLAQIALDLRQLRVGRVVLRPRTLE